LPDSQSASQSAHSSRDLDAVLAVKLFCRSANADVVVHGVLRGSKGWAAQTASRRDCHWRSDWWCVVVPVKAVLDSRRARRRTGRAPFVSMVKATDLGNRHDGAIGGRDDRTWNRRVFVQLTSACGTVRGTNSTGSPRRQRRRCDDEVRPHRRSKDAVFERTTLASAQLPEDHCLRCQRRVGFEPACARALRRDPSVHLGDGLSRGR